MWFLYAEILLLVTLAFVVGAVVARIVVRVVLDPPPTSETDPFSLPPGGGAL